MFKFENLKPSGCEKLKVTEKTLKVMTNAVQKCARASKTVESEIIGEIGTTHGLRRKIRKLFGHSLC